MPLMTAETAGLQRLHDRRQRHLSRLSLRGFLSRAPLVCLLAFERVLIARRKRVQTRGGSSCLLAVRT
jgi:hypothetical protein